MKACKLYIDTEYLAEKLGIEENQFVIGEVSSNHSQIEFTIFIDENAITKVEEKTVEISNGHLNIRRSRF